LGAQLIAHVLGARVFRNRFKEIGWFPVHATPDGRTQWELPKEIVVFHWHGDAFDVPKGAVHLAKSAACEQQMFALGTGIVGIQFHLEAAMGDVASFVHNGAAELGEGPYVQTPEAMTASNRHVAPAHALLDSILDRWST
jgi:GMP synthase (glutamine-hydrolysing)